MEQLPIKVSIREANLKAVKQLLKGINETIKAIRRIDDCSTFKMPNNKYKTYLFISDKT